MTTQTVTDVERDVHTQELFELHPQLRGSAKANSEFFEFAAPEGLKDEVLKLARRLEDPEDVIQAIAWEAVGKGRKVYANDPSNLVYVEALNDELVYASKGVTEEVLYGTIAVTGQLIMACDESIATLAQMGSMLGGEDMILAAWAHAEVAKTGDTSIDPLHGQL